MLIVLNFYDKVKTIFWLDCLFLCRNNFYFNFSVFVNSLNQPWSIYFHPADTVVAELVWPSLGIRYPGCFDGDCDSALLDGAKRLHSHSGRWK